MEHIEEKIFCYGVLEEDEQEQVRAFITDHPSYAGLFNASLAFYRLLEEARQMIKPDEMDEVLLYYVHHKKADKKAPAALQKAYQQIELLLKQKPDLQQRYEELSARYQRLDQHSNPEAQFRLLSTMASTEPHTGGADRPARTRKQSASWRKGIVMAIVVGIGALISNFYPTPLKRLAYLPSDELEVPGLIIVYRNSAPMVDHRPERLLADALLSFDRAQVEPFMNLLYYRKTLLDEAEDALRQAIIAYEPHSFLMQESQYFLAKVLLAKKKTEEARIILTALAQTDTQRAATATAMLEVLETSSVRF